jgi:hypothetical protein
MQMGRGVRNERSDARPCPGINLATNAENISQQYIQRRGVFRVDIPLFPCKPHPSEDPCVKGVPSGRTMSGKASVISSFSANMPLKLVTITGAQPSDCVCKQPGRRWRTTCRHKWGHGVKILARPYMYGIITSSASMLSIRRCRMLLEHTVAKSRSSGHVYSVHNVHGV